MYAGFGLAIGSWLSAALILAVVIVPHLPRIRIEEAELESALGNEYRDYERATARLVPGIW
jgi:protein-S-isoprenylcysteine O-methyltransferase Ste14